MGQVSQRLAPRYQVIALVEEFWNLRLISQTMNLYTVVYIGIEHNNVQKQYGQWCYYDALTGEYVPFTFQHRVTVILEWLADSQPGFEYAV